MADKQYELLSEIEKENDIKKIPKEKYGQLAKEIREFLINSISETGGHLGSNLGAVELTMALHLSLNLPEDKIVWDVGHQSYTHKILTGRKDGFDNLRSYKICLLGKAFAKRDDVKPTPEEYEQAISFYCLAFDTTKEEVEKNELKEEAMRSFYVQYAITSLRRYFRSKIRFSTRSFTDMALDF